MLYSTGSENVLAHLRQRGLNPDLYPTAFADRDVVVFYLTDFSGRVVGFQQYRPAGDKKLVNKDAGKYWSYSPKETIAVLGLASLDNPGPVYLTGGLFKAATLHRLGYAALHVSATSYKLLKPQLWLLNRTYLAVGDNDAEGAQFVRRYGGFQSPKDLDEMSDGEVRELLSLSSSRNDSR